jgi:integrase
MARTPGQIIERDSGKFTIRVYIGTDARGRRRYVNRTINGTKKEAQKVLTAMLRERDLGLLKERSSQPLGNYLDEWLKAAAKPRLQESTYKEYVGQLDRYIRGPLGGVKLSKLDAMTIQGVYGDMQTRGLSARTVRLTHAILRSALAQAVKWGHLPANPADFVDLPKQKRQEMKAMSEAEAGRFLAAAESSQWHVLFALLLTTGLRPSEALALRWTDVDLAGHKLTVNRKVTKVDGEWIYGPPKTASGRRTVDLPEGSTRLLAGHQRDGELVFTNGNGEPPDRRSIVENHYKATLERAGLDIDFRLYDLRHTHATLLLLAGVHPKIVSERLGHASINITLDTYSHVLPGMQKESAAKLNEMLFQTRAGVEQVSTYN